MTYDIVIGRKKSDIEKYGKKGTIFFARQFVQMGQITSLANNLYFDVSKSHVVFVCGKRGGGKSYTMGVIAEGIANLEPEIAKNLSAIFLDTMGIYWTMKYPNHKDDTLLKEWGLEGKSLNVQIFTPVGYFKEYKERGIPTDYPYSIKPNELSAQDWMMSFRLDATNPVSVLIEAAIEEIKKNKKEYDIEDILKQLKSDQNSEPHFIQAAVNHFKSAISWGVFSKDGTPFKDLVMGGKITVIDVSCYATIPNGWEIKSLVIGLIAQKLFIDRMVSRKNEEFRAIQSAEHYFRQVETYEQKPLVWLIIDEAHEFLPNLGKTSATDSLVTILREGRQPGISLILATQQPGKIHTDVMTQSDIIISHRITARIDIDALSMLTQSYMREDLGKQFAALPRLVGSAVILDDQNERIYQVKIRPRFTWHGGEAPSALIDITPGNIDLKNKENLENIF
ncbi:ATP-binding protein [Candidatus Woesearchaeota archaeon]|nr:ATP-binding protein [Candidatus Woesearchaeota archaeon]